MSLSAPKTSTRPGKASLQDPHPAREVRLSIRTSTEQKALLKRAAKSTGADLSQFVLEASLEQARKVVADESVLVLSSKDYERLCQALDEAPVANSALRQLLHAKRVWDE